MSENQKSITNWADSTFGFCSRQAAIERMIKEVDELKAIVYDGTNPEVFNQMSNECADILITLYRIADTFGFNLHSCVDLKMEINRGRKWKSNGDGTGQHIKDEQ